MDTIEKLACEKNVGTALDRRGNDKPALWEGIPDEMRALLQPPALEAAKRVLCVQPHPDDNEIGMGGTVAHLTANGCHVDYLTVTDGRLGNLDGKLAPDELARERKAETIAAAKALGVEECRFLGYADGTLADVPELAGRIAEVVREGGYDTLFCPDPWSPYEAHCDHVAVGRAVAQAAVSANLFAYPEGTRTPPANVRAVGFYFTAQPNTVVDVTDEQERKLAAIACHRTQMTPELMQMYGAHFVLRGRSLTGSERIGEGFKALSPLHLHCFPEAASL